MKRFLSNLMLCVFSLYLLYKGAYYLTGGDWFGGGLMFVCGLIMAAFTVLYNHPDIKKPIYILKPLKRKNG